MITILSLDPERRYLGVGPHVAACRSVEDFIERNSLKNCQILPVALAEMLIRKDASAWPTATLIRGFRQDDFYDARKAVLALPGDDVLTWLNLKNISIIKIDAEGAELEVMRGFEQSISTFRPFLVFEILNFNLYAPQQSASHRPSKELDADAVRFRRERIREMEKFLAEDSYEVLQILPGKLPDRASNRPYPFCYDGRHKLHCDAFREPGVASRGIPVQSTNRSLKSELNHQPEPPQAPQ